MCAQGSKINQYFSNGLIKFKQQTLDYYLRQNLKYSGQEQIYKS